MQVFRVQLQIAKSRARQTDFEDPAVEINTTGFKEGKEKKKENWFGSAPVWFRKKKDDPSQLLGRLFQKNRALLERRQARRLGLMAG